MKPFKEVIDGIRKAVMAHEVREDLAQMGEYVEQFANTAGENIQKAIDPTLSLSGKAADAAKTGEAVNAEATRAKGVENQLKEESVLQKAMVYADEYVTTEHLFIKQKQFHRQFLLEHYCVTAL